MIMTLRRLVLPLSLLMGGLIVGAFLVVQDEILTLAIYCGRDCKYPYPLGPPLPLYAAEEVATGMIILGIALFASALVHVLLKFSESQKPQ